MDLFSNYIIHQADNALILGHRNSEWTGHGPILEQDIALSNIALDLIGQARNFYQLAASRINELEPGEMITEDDLAYLRDGNEFRNFILVEQPNGDWAKTILRQFYFSSFQLLQFRELLNSENADLAAISEKSIKETRYHVKWSSEWVIRLGDGTSASHLRMTNAQQDLYPFIAELFVPADFDYEAESSGAGFLPEKLKDEWFQRVNNIFETATLPMISAGKKAMHILSGKKWCSFRNILDFCLLKCNFSKEHTQAAPGSMEEWKYGSLEVYEIDTMNKEEIIEILSEVRDPEIPVLTISDLGILRAVDYANDLIQIQITPTYSGCPAMEIIQEDIRTELAKHGLKNVQIKQVLSPAWTSDWMSEAGKQKLMAYGIAAPATHACFLSGEDKPESCPLCHSKNIEMISRFGSTSCKALYRCLDCREPFDYFKCH